MTAAHVNMKLDLRPRCERCRKLITRGRIAQDNWKRYKPYCSYHCQQWAQLEGAQRYINQIRALDRTTD